MQTKMHQEQIKCKAKIQSNWENTQFSNKKNRKYSSEKKTTELINLERLQSIRKHTKCAKSIRIQIIKTNPETNNKFQRNAINT